MTQRGLALLEWALFCAIVAVLWMWLPWTPTP